MPINRAQSAQNKPDTPTAAQSLTQPNTMEPTLAGMSVPAGWPLSLARTSRAVARIRLTLARIPVPSSKRTLGDGPRTRTLIFSHETFVGIVSL